MAITMEQPRTIYLGGGTGEPPVEINDIVASEAITPGMLIERFNSSGTPKFRKHSTAAGSGAKTVALNQAMMNLGVSDAYAAGDLVDAMVGYAGCTFWMLIASGANIAAGDKLESAGNGKLKAVTAGFPMFIAIENVNNTAGPSDARIRVEAL